MLFVSGKSPNLSLTHRVYDFFTDSYEIASDVEIFHTDLSDDNAVGFTEICLLYTSPSPRDVEESRMPSSA